MIESIDQDLGQYFIESLEADRALYKNTNLKGIW